MNPPQEQAKFWRDPILKGLEMLRATFVTYSFSRHVHEGFGIAIVENGSMAFEYQGFTHVAPAGSVVVMHPDEVHTGYAASETGWTYRTLLPVADLVQQAASDLSGRTAAIPYFPEPVIYDGQLNQALVHLHRLLETSPSALERESHFLWSMAQLVHHYACDRPQPCSIGREPRAIATARDYLSAHYQNNVSLDDLATRVGLNPLRLLRVFRRQVGLPPHAYQVQVRVQQAKKLLADGLPIAQVAFDTGFTDQSHLNRHFKRMVGVTPGQYAMGCKHVMRCKK